MRMLVIAALAVACSSEQRPEAPSQPWTVERAVAAIPADASVVMTLDTGRLRASPVLAPRWPELIAFVEQRDKRPYRELCHDRDARMLAVMFDDLSWTIWIFGVPVRELEACRRSSADTTSLALDDRTLLIRIAKDAPDEAGLRALAAPVANPLRAPELDWVVASGTPFGVYVAGAPGRLAALIEAQPIGSALIAEAGDRLTLRSRVRFADAATARGLADRASQYLNRLDRTLVTSGRATAAAATTELEVTWEHEPLIALAAKIGPNLP